ncbi:MAG: hypothetical protein HZB42_06215 [Sphingobacteriales bacterium]|nr:hypothetical protein [Sphingobacteriales bacterium]
MRKIHSLKAWLSCIIFPIFIFGCKQTKNADQYIRELNTSDTFRYEFTVNGKGEFDSLEYFYKKEFENFLKLPSLEKGFDSIQIRISYGCAMGSNMLVTLWNQQNIWNAEVRRIGDNYTDKNLQIHPVLQRIECKIPRSGWRVFLNKLFKLKVLSLEDNGRIPGFNYYVPADGCIMAVEIATKNVYRFYSYENPDMYEDKYWQGKNVLAILRLINKELSIDTDWPSDEDEEPTISPPIKIHEIELRDAKDSLKEH